MSAVLAVLAVLGPKLMELGMCSRLGSESFPHSSGSVRSQTLNTDTDVNPLNPFKFFNVCLPHTLHSVTLASLCPFTFSHLSAFAHFDSLGSTSTFFLRALSLS